MLIKEISLVIPALSEEGSLPALINEIKESFSDTSYKYEIIIIDDGSPIQVESFLSNDDITKIIREPFTKDSLMEYFKELIMQNLIMSVH